MTEPGVLECAVITFGCNDDGQLGRGVKRLSTAAIDDVTDANYPQQVGALRGHDVIAVSCGSRHTMALTSKGEVFSWGWGTMGQLGHGDLKSSAIPRRIEYFVENSIEIVYISCGGCHSGAVARNGDLYMWGEAHWGQLGLPKEYQDPYQVLPAKCPILKENTNEKLVKISCGGAHSAALTDQGRVYMWGRCDSGQLGIGEDWLHESEGAGTLGVNLPHVVEDFDGQKIAQVACGAFHTAAVTESGSVYIWGKEDYGMLGVGQTSDIQTPQRIEFFEKEPANRVSCGGWHTVVVTRSGKCYAFGRGEYGRLGLGDTKSRYKPALVEALKDQFIVQAACGGTHTLFLTSDGEAYSVGRTDHGRLGHESKSIPKALDRSIMGAIPVCQVSAGGAHSIALMHSNRPRFSPLMPPAPSSMGISQLELK